MIVANGVAAFALSSSILGHDNVIYPVLLWDDTSAVLVDSGYPNHYQAVLDETKKITGSLELLKAIVITHQDMDHIGGGAGIIKALGRDIETIAHYEDAPYIQGDLQLLKFNPENIEAIMRSLPDDIPAERRKTFRYALEHPPKRCLSQLQYEE
jgi:glyoxylase-like metal-dependent hydrolase (beta-lactamase superfamily II)